jgi:hypothetical protein
MARVFVSYVSENSAAVTRLAKELRNNGVTVWLDRDDIEPGARWKDEIKKGIQGGDFFLACFSKEADERDRTYMREEINLAIDELRLRPQDRKWFIPLLINDTNIPSYRINNAFELSDIQAVKLYEDWDTGVSRILRVLGQDYSVRTENTPPIKSPIDAAPEYFCYISMNKIDELLEGTPTHGSDVPKTGAPAEIDALIADKTPFGRTDIIQPKALRREYSQKLRDVLEDLRPYIITFRWEKKDLDYGTLCWARLRFSCELTSNDEMVRLSSIGPEKRLLLYCSLTNFSGRLVQNGKWVHNSTSYAFFNESARMFFETVFFITDFNGDTIVGSPLFLKIPITKGLLL